MFQSRVGSVDELTARNGFARLATRTSGSRQMSDGADARSTPDAEAYLRSAFEDAPIGIALISIDPEIEGSFLRVNRALCELTGYSSEKLQLTSIHALLHPDDLTTDIAAMTRLNQGEVDGFQLEQRLLHAERHAVWVTVNASLVRDAVGDPLYCIRQLQDIEERKRYESELGYLLAPEIVAGPSGSFKRIRPANGLFSDRGGR
jgi:PAS domain S-box-containing protein